MTALWPMIAAMLLMPARAADPASDARFVGSPTCAVCHATQYAAWQGSRHRAAMQIAGR